MAQAHRITVQPVVDDALSREIFKTLKDQLPHSRLKQVAVTFSYATDASLTKPALQKIAGQLINPITEKSAVNRVLIPKNFSYVLEIGFRPGVTDNVGNTAREMIESVLNKKLPAGSGVYSSVFIFLDGKVSKKDAEVFSNELHNPLIEQATITSKTAFKPKQQPIVPKVKLVGVSKVVQVNLNVRDEELTTIGKQGILDADGTRRGPLALSLSEMQHIRDHFKTVGRNPTDIELESLAQTWSEHCTHTIFNDPLDDIKEGVYKHYIRGATKVIRKKMGEKDFCDSVFVDNSGSIVFNDEYHVTHKVETHNSPSALDPFGGAITGIVGVNRDVIGFGLGAKPIANVYGFCVGHSKDKTLLYRGKNKERPLLSARRIFEGVVKGINEGGNQSGIPTPLGFVATDSRYRGKPLVFAGTVGLIPKKRGGRKLSYKKALPGDYVVMIGGKVGLDGIHGATFSSEALGSNSPATAVQIGDPITQKKLSDALVLNARDKNLYSSLTDNGAGGLSCSVAEMAKECGGFDVDLDTVPLKYPGLSPWQIWISESQERMTLSIPKNKWRAFKAIMDTHDVEATRIGTFTKSGKCVVRVKGKKVLDMSMSFLHDGRVPVKQYSRKVVKVGNNPPLNIRKKEQKTLLTLLSRPNIGSYSFISRQYDHEVQGTSVTKPLQGKAQVNADAGVLQPLSDSKKGLVVSQGYLPWYSDLDAYAMAAASLDTAIRNTVTAGGTLNHLAILDNFCWSSGSSPERLYELKEATRACYDGAVAYGTPFISGKDSMFNDFKGYTSRGKFIHVQVPPTLLVSALSVVKDVKVSTSIDFKSEDNLIYLLGETHEEFGGTEYMSLLSEKTKKVYLGEQVPHTDFKKNKKIYRAFESANKKGLVASAISVGRGGLAVALSKAAIAGDLGATISLKGMLGRAKETDALLFSESQGRILVTVHSRNKKAFEKSLGTIPYKKIGKVSSDKEILITKKNRRMIVRLPLSKVKTAYTKAFRGW